MSSASGRRRRPQEIHLPDGKKVIVTLPENLDALRRQYAATHDCQEPQIEVVVHGSHEHHDFLRQSREHHEGRKLHLRRQHGPAFDEWEHVHNQLNSVTAELENLSNSASDLSANFSKFGYDANLRTYDEGRASSTPSISDTESSKSWGDPRPGETIKLFKRPVVKQWFHKGLMWRASESTEIMAIELFFDLLYVGVIHINGEHLAEEPNGHELLRYAVTFMMSWKIWTDVTQLLSWFETDDVFTRFQILFEIACLLGFTTNLTYSFYEDPAHNTYTQLVAFYLAARLKNAAYYASCAYLLPMIRGVMICQAVNIVVPSAIWIASIHVSMPNRLALIFPALALDLYGQAFIIAAMRYGRLREEKKGVSGRLAAFFEFFPAMNIEHRVERMNAFVSLVLGYSVVGVMFQSYGGYNINGFLGKAVLGLVQAFLFNWIYFDVDGSGINLHAIRRSVNSATLWGFAHLPFIMGYILASAGLSKLVLITDVPGTNPGQLSSHYSPLAEESIPNGIRFFYCHGLAIALLSMGFISFSHEHRVPVDLRWSKPYRLANRFAACVVMFLLPLATSLSSTELISVTLGITAWVLLVELWGKSCRHDPFIGNAEGCCVSYSARCARRDLKKLKKLDSEETPERRSVEVEVMGEKDTTAV